MPNARELRRKLMSGQANPNPLPRFGGEGWGWLC